jgi:NADH-quinone oxidoreductase subunit N
VGKAMLFGAAMGAGMTWLAVVAAANSALSLYYYARVLEVSYLRAPVAGDGLRSTNIRWTVGVVLAASLATLLLGVFPAQLVALATHASTMVHTTAAAAP